MTLFKIVNGIVSQLTDAEAKDLKAKDVAYVAGEDERLASELRNQRDRLLSDTDWMALSDNTMTPAWASYRQALRDITGQAGFPYSVNWPTKP